MTSQQKLRVLAILPDIQIIDIKIHLAIACLLQFQKETQHFKSRHKNIELTVAKSAK